MVSILLFRPVIPASDALSPPDIEWKLIYVGSAESTSHDQELDSCMVGPVPVGVNSFEFEVRAMKPTKRRQLTIKARPQRRPTGSSLLRIFWGSPSSF
jgi:hypothetical protein